MQQPKVLHFTEGGVWHAVFDEFSQQWLDEFKHMVGGDNPCAEVLQTIEADEVAIVVGFREVSVEQAQSTI